MDLQAAAPTVRKIDFVPAVRKDAHSVDVSSLKHFIILDESVVNKAEGNESMVQARGMNREAAGLAQELFPAAALTLQWKTITKSGAGLQNLGNTCFMNSVLQCLMHTPPLAEVLASELPLTKGASALAGLHDALSITRDLFRRSLLHRSSVLSPLAHARTLRRISKSFRPGRQEDAHEYLVSLLDALHESLLKGQGPRPPPPLARTTLVYQVFGGSLRSCVRCSQCGLESARQEPFLDIPLEVSASGGVLRALERFTASEVLEGANAYRCGRCGRPGRALKSLRVDAAPRVLALALKRFEYARGGRKIARHVDYPVELDLGPFLARAPRGAGGGLGDGRPRGSLLYDLYAVLVHQGQSVHSGHYYACVKAPSGTWNLADDVSVAPVSERSVLAQRAYILFYIRRGGEAALGVQAASVAKADAANVAEFVARPSPVLGPGQLPLPASPASPALANGQRSAAAAPPTPTLPLLRAEGREAKRARDGEELGEDKELALGRAPVAANGSRSLARPALGSHLAATAHGRRLAAHLARSRLRGLKDAGGGGDGSRRRRGAGGAEEEEEALTGSSPCFLAACSPSLAASSAPAVAASPPPALASPSPSPPASPRSPSPVSPRAPGQTRARAARALVQAGAGSLLEADVAPWEDAPQSLKRRHDRVLREAKAPRRQPDELDAEYDRGRLKKVRRREEAGGEGLRDALQAALEARRRGEAPEPQRGGRGRGRGGFRGRGRGFGARGRGRWRR